MQTWLHARILDELSDQPGVFDGYNAFVLRMSIPAMAIHPHISPGLPVRAKMCTEHLDSSLA